MDITCLLTSSNKTRMFSFENTRESIQYYPTGTGISSLKCPVATGLHCPCCNHSLEPNHDPQLEDLYSSDEFRMYRFKVQRCPFSRTSHDWTDCPYLHPGEKARRRDPGKFPYSSEICSNFRKNGKCAKRDECEFAHGVFEAWLHPDKYRTELCRDGMACKRKVCFFAHSMEQFRWPDEGDSDQTSESEVASIPVFQADPAHLPILSSILRKMMADMQQKSSSEIRKNRTLCGGDLFGGSLLEVPDIKWVSDLVDF